MPHVTVKGISQNEASKLAGDLKKIIVDASGSKKEYVKIFYSPVVRIDGPDEPAIDVYWMQRTQEICDRVSAALTQFLQSQGYTFTQVTFREFPGELFYENGVHY